jgi:hypothetical protein
MDLKKKYYWFVVVVLSLGCHCLRRRKVVGGKMQDSRARHRTKPIPISWQLRRADIGPMISV